MRFRVTRTARRHRIGNAHILAAIIDAGAPVEIEIERGMQLHYVGVDDRGVELHVIAVPDDRSPGDMSIIHAMPTALREPGIPDGEDGRSSDEQEGNDER